MSIADHLAERALSAAERTTDPEVARICAYIFDQATSGRRSDGDLTHLAGTLHIHTREVTH